MFQYLSKLTHPLIKKRFFRNSTPQSSESREIPPNLPVFEAEDDLNPTTIWYKTTEELEQLLATLPLEDLKARFQQDRWLYNYLLSIWENVHGCTHLNSYPWNITLGITGTCNAKCPFCSVPQRRSRPTVLDADPEDIPHLALLLSYVRILLITGGEPTIHPRFSRMLQWLKDTLDPRAYVNMITNGHRLHHFETELSQINVNFAISLNAATASTHHKLMQLGEDAFDQILDSIRWARSLGRNVDLSLVVVKDNLAEIPDFLHLAEELGVHGVYLRTLIPGSYYAMLYPNPENFASLPPWHHPDLAFWQERARQTIQEVNVAVYADLDQWGVPLQSADLPANTDPAVLMDSVRQHPALIMTKGDPLPPDSLRDHWRQPVANPYQRTAPFLCSYPWYALKILDSSLRLYPCGFIHQIMGYDDVGLHGAEDFLDLWNSPAMVHLRETLQKGPLLPECITCPYQMIGQRQSNAQTSKD